MKNKIEEKYIKAFAELDSEILKIEDRNKRLLLMKNIIANMSHVDAIKILNELVECLNPHCMTTIPSVL